MFRVRDKRNNKWVGNGEKFYLNRTDDLIQVKRKFFKTKEVLVRPSNYEYQRSIGICDKDGIPIFEGDIVDAAIMNEVIRTLCYFSCDTCSYVLLDMNNDKYYSLSKQKSRVIKVVGNIYDNPTMLRE